jgi:DNA-binding beta-propeller fold protein YncE
MRTVLGGFVLVLACASASLSDQAGYKLLKTIPVPGEGGWDYLIVDDAGRRVYVSHGDRVDVLDADSYEIVGKVPDLKGVHGIALARSLGRGFISNGKAATVTIFDLENLKKLGEVKTGKNPDAIIYDPASKRVFAFNGGDKNATVIDAADGMVAGTIDVGGRPEFAVADGAGHVFVNLENKHMVVKIDSKDLKVLEKWPLAPGEEPSGLAMNPASRRLFVGCSNKLLIIMDAECGKVVGKEPIGEGVDATAFDPETKLIYNSCRDGTVTVVREDGDDKYKIVETVKTKRGSKTMALDAKTHRIILPSAEFKPGATPRARPTMVPGTFAVLVYGK